MEKEIKTEVVDCGADARIYICRLNPAFSSAPFAAGLQPPPAFSAHRKTEWLTVRYLLAQAGYHQEVQYADKGKPVLPGSGMHISISHSRDYAAVMVSPVPCGVDVEKISDRAARVAHKFLSGPEKELASGVHQDRDFTLFWSAKESLYKITGSPDFLKSFRIVSLPPGGNVFDVEHIKGKNVTRYRVFYTIFDGHVLTWIHEG